jgi:hypothetical protein
MRAVGFRTQTNALPTRAEVARSHKTEEDRGSLVEAAVQLLSWAYFRTALYAGDSAWQKAQSALTSAANPLGRVDSR